MNKLLAPFALGASMFLITPTFAADNAELYNPAVRTGHMSTMGYNLPVKVGTNYAYWHHRHWRWGYHHRWHRWHRHHYRHYY